MCEPSSGGGPGGAPLDAGCGGGVEPPLPARGAAGDEPLFLVPVDFSAESRVAVSYARALAQSCGGAVRLLHVAPPGGAGAVAAEVGWMYRTLDLPSSLELDVLEGDLEEELPGAARRVGARYVVLTSRAVRDPERFKRSRVLRLLRRGTIPYIALQRAPARQEVRTVIFPMDYTDESRMALPHLADLHRRFAPVFHLVTFGVNEPELYDRVEEHLDRTVELLEGLGARYVHHQVESLEECAGALREYSEQVRADLLLLVSSIDPRGAGHFMLEPHDRALLQQSGGMGVLIINPEGTEC